MTTGRRTQAVLALWASAILAMPAWAAKNEETRETKKIAEFRLSGPITELPPPELALFGLDEQKPQSLKDILQRMKKARLDSDVVAVVLTLDNPGMGWGQMQELREAILRLRAADKDVYCHIESAESGEYLLAAAATRLSIVPTGEIGLVGLYSESPYIKPLLDKIRVEADMEHIGEYKGAAEPLMRDGPSDEAREQMNWLLDDIYAQMIDGVARGRSLPADQVRKLIDEGPYTAACALEAKLVDAVEYRDEFMKHVEKKYGKTAKLVRNYGGPKGPDLDFSNPFAIFKLLGEMMQQVKEGDKPAVAVVYIDGMIVSGRSEDSLFGSSTVGSTTIRAVLDKARKDENVKAIVLRVNSPGGSALASEIMWHAAKLCAKEKPLVVSMGNVAASGGYYVSVAAGTIFADPGTITGSIGIVGGKIVTKGLWDWAGINFYEYKRGQNADLFNSNRKWDDRERAIVRRHMEEVYDVFTAHVKEGRGQNLKDDIEKLARGRVYTGRQAKEKGLIDRLGGLDDAVKFAAEQASITDYDVRVLPRPKNFIELLMKGLGVDEDEEGAFGVRATARQWPITGPAMQMLAPAIQQISPARARMITRFLLRLDMLRRERAITVLPTEMLIGGMGW